MDHCGENAASPLRAGLPDTAAAIEERSMGKIFPCMMVSFEVRFAFVLTKLYMFAKFP